MAERKLHPFGVEVNHICAPHSDRPFGVLEEPWQGHIPKFSFGTLLPKGQTKSLDVKIFEMQNWESWLFNNPEGMA